MERSAPSTLSEPSVQYTYLADGNTARSLLQMGQHNSGGAVAVLIRDNDVGPLRWLELSIAC